MRNQINNFLKEKGMIHECKILYYHEIKHGELFSFLNNNKDDFHVLLRKKDSSNGADFTINIFNESILPKSRESVFEKSDNFWYDVVVSESIFISISDEPVGLQLEFDNATCIEALLISDEILTNIEHIEKEKGEIWLIMNTDVVEIPLL